MGKITCDVPFSEQVNSTDPHFTEKTDLPGLNKLFLLRGDLIPLISDRPSISTQEI